MRSCIPISPSSSSTQIVMPFYPAKYISCGCNPVAKPTEELDLRLITITAIFIATLVCLQHFPFPTFRPCSEVTLLRLPHQGIKFTMVVGGIATVERILPLEQMIGGEIRWMDQI